MAYVNIWNSLLPELRLAKSNTPGIKQYRIADLNYQVEESQFH